MVKQDLTGMYPPVANESTVWTALYALKGGGCWNVQWGKYSDAKMISYETALALARQHLAKNPRVCILKTVQHGTPTYNGW